MVTGYQIKKWAKAAGLIIFGIILIFSLDEYQTGIQMAPSFVRDSVTMQFISMLMIYSIAGTFVSAAVNIAAGFIGKSKGMSLSQVNKKVNALDRRIQALNWQTSPLGMMSATPVMMNAAQPDKASKKGKAAVIAVVAILIIAVLAVGLFMFGSGGSPAPGADSAEQAFNSFLDRMNLGDAQGAIGKTVFTFASNSSDYVTMLDQMLSQGSIHLTLISGPTVFSQQMINATEKADVEARVAEIESAYGVTVTEYSVIAFKISVSMPGGSDTISQRMPCVLIKDKWYLDAKQLFSNRGDNGNGNGNPKIEVFLNKNIMPGGNWSLIVSGLNNTNSIPNSQVYLEIKDSYGGIMFSKSLNSMTTGVPDSGIIFNDASSTGNLDQGDGFVLDGSIYVSGSEFILMKDLSGSTVYADLKL